MQRTHYSKFKSYSKYIFVIEEISSLNFVTFEFCDIVCMCVFIIWHSFFLTVYLFIMYTIFCLHVCLQARRGHQTSLQMAVSHHVVAGN